MTDTITVCPNRECDSPHIHRNSPNKPNATAAADWHCSACGADFDDPREREPLSPAGGPGGLAGALLDADPEAVSADD